VQEVLAFMAGTIGGYFIGCGLITSLIIDSDTLVKTHAALLGGSGFVVGCWVYALYTGDTRPIDTCSMIMLVGVLATIIWNYERTPNVANTSFLGMLFISTAVAVRERAPNTPYISSTDVYALWPLLL